MRYAAIGWLAQDFDLRAGYVEVTVPEDLEPGNDYSITRACHPSLLFSSYSHPRSLRRLWQHQRGIHDQGGLNHQADANGLIHHRPTVARVVDTDTLPRDD